MKKISSIGILLSLITVLSALLLTSCDIGYSPLKKGMIYTEMEGGYMVEPMPLDVTPERIAKKILTTVSLDIPESYMGEPVVGVRGFFIYPALVEVTIPDTVTYITRNSFGPLVQCNEYGGALYLGNDDNPYLALVKPKDDNLASCEIHPDAKVIAVDAFENCGALESIIFKGNIPPYNYNTIPTLSRVVLDATELVGGRMFYDDGLSDLVKCNGLKTAVFKGSSSYKLDFSSSSVTELVIEGDADIPDGGFANYTSLERLEIAGSFKKIGEGAFAGCASLTEVTVGGSATTVSSHAFKDCTSLRSVALGDAVTYVDDRAFENCSSLSDLMIGSSVHYFGIRAFGGCTSLTAPGIHENNQTFSVIDGSLYSKDGTVLLHCLGCRADGSFDFPDTVTAIGRDAFRDVTELERIIIPDAITSIGESAFKGCTALESISFGNALTDIGSAAFADCTSLATISLPSSLASIGNRAFQNCSLLTEVEIPDSVTSIGSEAFFGCSALESITLPYVYEFAFGYIFGREEFFGSEGTLIYPDPGAESYYVPSSLKSVTVTGGEVRDNAFSQCASITSITIRDSVTGVGSNAFRGCRSLESISLPASLTVIGTGAFADCTSLKSIRIPESVTKIGVRVFENCTSLLSVALSEAVTDIGLYAFHGCTALESIELPDSVTEIGDLAFYGCTSLKELTLGGSVKRIGGEAFYGCTSLADVELSGSVSYIGRKAFGGCAALGSVAFENTEGWIYTKATTDNVIPAADLADPERAAECLTATYASYNWERTE